VIVFVISKLLWLVCAPSMALLIIGCIGLALVARHRRRAGLACLSVSLGAFAAIALLPIGDLLLGTLENRFPEVRTLPPDVSGIIVLGGAVETDLSEARDMPSLNEAAERMTSLVTLARHYPKAQLAFTGGNGLLIHGKMNEATVARDLFTALGVDQSRMVYEGRSRTTYENAVLLKAQLHPKPGETWLLVTSAWHMPRSVGLFRHAGWDVLPYPVGYKTAPDPIMTFRGSFPERLEMVDVASHEWSGLVAYWLMGRTSALFPAPQGVTPR
jgi:uncharacterized SAM-binding protein YcdF (DUF218 family)